MHHQQLMDSNSNFIYNSSRENRNRNSCENASALAKDEEGLFLNIFANSDGLAHATKLSYKNFEFPGLSRDQNFQP